MQIDTPALEKYARYKPLLLPFAVIAVIFVLTLTLGRLMFDHLDTVRANIGTLNQNNEILTGKEELLAALSKEDLSTQAQNSLNAVPGESPALFALSTVRETAQARGLTVSDVRVSTGSGTNQIELSITFEGGIIPTLLFIADTRGATPLMRVSKLEFGGKDEILPKARLTVVASWAPVPSSLGSSDTPLEGLTSADAEVLTKLNQLKSPAGGVFTPQTGTGRQNPFEF